MIKIVIDGIELTCSDVRQAMDVLYEVKKKEILSKSPRCHKCVYENICSKDDKDGKCKDYKRDPPDGGYYG